MRWADFDLTTSVGEDGGRVWDATEEFFDHLCRYGHEMLLAKVTATIRVELEEGDGTSYWFLDLNGGRIRVSRKCCPADCVIRADAGLFDRLVTGETNMLAALLRNQVTVEGDVPLYVILRRMLPGPPGAHDSKVQGR